MKKKFSTVLIVLTLLLGLVPMVYAQTGTGATPRPTGTGSTPRPTGTGATPSNPSFVVKIQNPLKGNTSDIYSFMKSIINNILIPIGGVIAALYIMYAGFLLVTAQGNEGQIKKGRDAFFWAVIGTAVLLGAWVIFDGVKATIDQITR